MGSFTELLSGYLEPYAFRRKAFSLSHAYLRGSPTFNNQRILEIADDAPAYVNELIKGDQGRLSHFDERAEDIGVSPIDNKRNIKSFSMQPEEAENVAARLHLPLNLKQEAAAFLHPTETAVEIIPEKPEKLWLFRAYDPYRPLINTGLHSFPDFKEHPEQEKEHESDIERARLSARILDALEHALGNEKAPFVYTHKDGEYISLLTPEHIAKALEAECKTQNLALKVEGPLPMIEGKPTHVGTSAPKDGLFR